MSTAELLHETSRGLTDPQNIYELQRTYEKLIPVDYAPGVRRKIRVTVHHDSIYPSQSRYVAEVFDGTRWNQVVRIDGEDPAIDMASGFVPPDRRGEVRQSAEAMAGELLGRAIQVLSPGSGA